MRAIILGCTVVVVYLSLAGVGFGESPDPPLENKRLTIHTLVREDIFAGWMDQDMERLARGEKNIDLLLEQRPAARAELLAWKGGATVYRAVLALEAGNEAEFQKLYDQARGLLAEAKKLQPKNPGVAAVVGGTYVVFGDRLPEKDRAAAWQDCYDNYQVLWQMQAPLVEKLPVHIKGELLAGLVQSAQRTGRAKELAEYLDKTIEVAGDTAYGRMAKEWKENPQAAVGANISCKTCHGQGRLSARLAATAGK
jgi:hypothetical protein